MKNIISILATVLLLTVSGNAGTVYIVPVTGMIDLGLAPYVERVLKEAEKGRADAVIFRINTFGGRVDAAVRIKDAILDAELPTYAFIDKRAISAGALISLSADSIAMTGGASIGAVTPVDGQGKKLSEKQVSYMRAEMRATAEKRGRPTLLAEAMVDESITVDGLVEEGKLLTLTTEEALKHGVADFQAEKLDDLLERIGLAGAEIIHTTENWAEKVVRFLSHPAVSSLLMTIGMLGIIFEVKTPGWGIGGTLGVVALALFFGSHYLVRLVGWEELLLFAAGFILLLLEAFVVPGFGITGILGIIAVTASLVLSFLGHLPSQGDLLVALASVTGALTITILVTVFIFSRLPGTGVFTHLILAGTVSGEQPAPPTTGPAPAAATAVGDTGTALSDLHPSGTATVNGSRIGVVSEGDYIESGTPVRVTEVHGNRIVVKKIT